MKSRSLIVLFISVISYTVSSNTFDWGKTGHRVTGQIADMYLKKRTKKKIRALLKGKSLAYVSTFADDIKGDPKYKKYSPWHYVNFSFDKKYNQENASPNGDLIKGIQKCILILKDEKASEADKVFYLKMLVHFIGDLHQPLHVGRSEDKGGNLIQVQWFNKGSNLHKVWDSGMIDQYGMSYSELAENITLSIKEDHNVIGGEIIEWATETQSIAKELYKTVSNGQQLAYNYMYTHFDIVQVQLFKGGIRLANILNDIFS